MKKRVYFIGIKGVAMTALAVYFLQSGYEVEGSDVNEIFTTDEILLKYGIQVKEGFHESNISEPYDIVVVTGAHGGMTNPEAKKAKQIGLEVVMHGEILGRCMEGNIGISVAGCHGKTTTSSLLAHLLVSAGLDPSYAIGVASINSLSEGGHSGTGEYFIAEADEYVTDPQSDKTPRFLWQHPKMIILTNIEFDHPDVYTNLDSVMEAYKKFINQLPSDGTLIACIDNPGVQSLVSNMAQTHITYGFSPQAEYHIDEISYVPGKTHMTVVHTSEEPRHFILSIPGRHNALNALASAIAANKAGVSWEDIQHDICLFTGTKRRFEKIYALGETILYDDYAHHPSEIEATIAAAREWYPQRRIVVIFQPHTFSRTKSLFDQFLHAFTSADFVIFPDIYPSARENFDPTITSGMLVQGLNTQKIEAVYRPTQADVVSELKSSVRSGDIIITMGAGDIASWHPSIVEIIEAKMVK